MLAMTVKLLSMDEFTFNLNKPLGSNKIRGSLWTLDEEFKSFWHLNFQKLTKNLKTVNGDFTSELSRKLWKKTDVFIGRPVTKQFNGNIVSQNSTCFFHKTCGKCTMNEYQDKAVKYA